MKLIYPICNLTFDCAPSRLKKSKTQPTCSRECAAELKHSLLELNTECSYCGKKLHYKPSHIGKYSYCSPECLKEHRKIIYKGENNPNAFCRIPEGNRVIHCGYYWVFYPKHPLATQSGYIREHRLVAEQNWLTDENSIEIDGKKYLDPKYDVHHIDLNKLNNNPENLLIVTRSEHQSIHINIRREALELYKDKHNL